ncbi:MAG: amino acid ABC transporter ATP-binding/permease protein [Lachnospiraceae bacterium]
MKKEKKKRRSGIQIMGALIRLVGPLLHIMIGAVILGTAGYLCAIFLTIFAGTAVLKGMSVPVEFLSSLTVGRVCIWMGVLAVLRGILHYAEQYCNHFIAFKLLAIIRHKVFAALRKLCPAKLEGKDKGNLISVITTDIELLEVFYAHTISPIAIAVLTSVCMLIFFGNYHGYAALLAAGAYLFVGAVIPLWNGKKGNQKGMEFREGFGELNSFLLDSLRGLDETLQYGQGEERKRQIKERSVRLSGLQKELSRMEGRGRSLTNGVILIASFSMLFLMLHLYEIRAVGFDGVVLCTIAMMGSFGPVVALSNLSNNLTQTLASGERVLSILEEEPLVEEIQENHLSVKSTVGFAGAQLKHVSFSYPNQEVEEPILKDCNLFIKPGKVTGILGESGCGKSTMLKLLMRFWKADSGEVYVDKRNVEQIPTKELRDMESYVTQQTHLFHDSIANNIAIGKEDASRLEIIEAAKKASIHEFIMGLPKGYDTPVGELGDTLSGGEKQRIGLARAFLHDAPLLLLDEPTSNLDSLNEGVILKSLEAEADKKTVVLVSHRESTMGFADMIYKVETS